MPRRKRPSPHDMVEADIQRAGSVGALERLAGIEPSQESRNQFWKPYARLPGAQGLDAGVAELKRRIRATAAGKNPRCRKGEAAS